MGNQSEKIYNKIIKLATNRAPYSILMLVNNKYRNNELHFKNKKIIKKEKMFSDETLLCTSEANGFLWSGNLGFMMEDHTNQPLS